MKLKIEYRHHLPSDSFAGLVRQEINELNTCHRIEEASVFIERQPRATPPFRISLHLITSGPELTEEANDHTLRTALGKVIARVREKLEPRGPLPRRTRRPISAVVLQQRGTPTPTQQPNNP